jgi:hypothetical protein
MATANGTSASADTLFSPALISPTVVSALPEGYTIRPLQRGDFELGFLDVLRVLTHVGDVTKQEFEGRFDEMKAGAAGYHVLVILDGEQKIVGTGALIVERKLYVNISAAGRVIADMCLQHPPSRPRWPHRGYRRREGPTRQEAGSADNPGIGLRGGEDRLLQDNPGLLRGERRLLR